MYTPNSAAIAGLIFSVMAICFGWIPYLGGFLWLCGIIFAVAGLRRNPHGMAWAALALSAAWLAAWLIIGTRLGSLESLTLFPYYLW